MYYVQVIYFFIDYTRTNLTYANLHTYTKTTKELLFIFALDKINLNFFCINVNNENVQ